MIQVSFYSRYIIAQRETCQQIAKLSKKQNWHKGDSQVSAPLILDPVAGPLVEQLQEECRRFQDKFGIRVSVVTRAGQSVRRDAKAEPLKVVGCEREECFPCTGDSERKRDCERNSVGYRITCLTCQQAGKLTTYDGESGRNGYARGLEHMQGLRTRSHKSPLWKHCILEHGGEEADFNMEVVTSHSSCLDRQVNEMVRIGGSRAEVILNSKSDFQQAPLVRLVTTTGLLEEQSSSLEAGRRQWQELGGQGRGGTAGRRPVGRRGGGIRRIGG